MPWDPSSVERDHLGQPVRHTAHTVSEWLSYLTHAEIDALQRLAQGLGRSPVVVNIGAGGGTSGLALLEARPDLYLVTVDTQKEASPYGSLAGEETVLRHAGLWGIRNEQIHGDSKAVGAAWARGAVDLVFIDGDHTYEGAGGDILAWLPHVKPGGIMALHDFQKERAYYEAYPDAPRTEAHLSAVVKPWPGVDRAVLDHLVGRYAGLAHVESLIAFKIERSELS